MKNIFSTCLLAALLSPLFSASLFGQEHTHADGTTHGAHGDETAEKSPADAPEGDHFTIYGQSDRYELTLYAPEIEAGKATTLQLFLADYQSNRPIEKAVLNVSLAENAAVVFEAKALSAGVYELRGQFPEQKTYGLNIQIAHPNGADLIGLTGIEVGKKLVAPASVGAEQSHAHAHWWQWALAVLAGFGLGWAFFRAKPRAAAAFLALVLVPAFFENARAHGDEPHGPKAGGGALGKLVEMPKESQFLFEITTQPIVIGDHRSAATMFGTVVPSSGGLGAVVAPQAGKILKISVAVGQKVSAGQTVAVLRQSVGAADAVGVAANNSALLLQIEGAKNRFSATKKELERLSKIADIAAGKDVQAAETNFQSAKNELETLEKRAFSANSTANERSVALVAPISGVVGAFTLAAGTEVAAGQTLLSITNLGKVFIEAQVYDRDLLSVQKGGRFTVSCSTDDHKTASVRLLSQALEMNAGNQSQRVLFEMDNAAGDFKIGEFVIVKAMTSQTSRQITVPNAALTEINGRTAVFLKHAPEEFELAFVQTGDDDGARTQILKGIEDGEKVVVSGAYEVKMMFLNQ